MDSALIKIDTPEEEDLVATLLLYAVAEYMRKTKMDIKYLNDIKLQKTIYKTSDDLNIPLTRSWYKRGCYVHNTNIRIETLKHILRSEINLEEVEQFKKGHKKEYESILKTITKNINNFKYISTKRLLDKLYQNRAPKKYRMLYQANNIILGTNTQIKESLKEKSSSLFNWGLINKSYYYSLVSNSISQVHVELATNKEFESIIDPYIDFTNFLESVYIKIDNILVPGSYIPIEISTLFESIDQIYYEYIWGCPALVISKETVKGIQAEDYKEKSEIQILKGFTGLDNVLNNLKIKSEMIGLSPTLEELECADKNLTGLSEEGSDKSLIEFWRIYNKV
jgi:hypothetical protein